MSLNAAGAKVDPFIQQKYIDIDIENRFMMQLLPLVLEPDKHNGEHPGRDQMLLLFPQRSQMPAGRDKEFFDVTLACGDDHYKAHKVVFSASNHFYNLKTLPNLKVKNIDRNYVASNSNKPAFSPSSSPPAGESLNDTNEAVSLWIL